MPKQTLIAIVDDDESLRLALRGLMKSVGFSAEVFASAEDFLASHLLPVAVCLIADMQMPGMSGIELHRRLVSSGSRIPVILITAYPDDATRTRALQAGVIAYLVKPFNDADLLECIHTALGLTSS
jgi:FixJ family two-component response regulator